MIRLYELRSEKNLSQRDMAKILNISQGTYNNWENANTQPSIEQLIAIAEFFGVTVDYLIGNTDDFGNVNYSLNEEQRKYLSLLARVNPQTKPAVIAILEELGKEKN